MIDELAGCEEVLRRIEQLRAGAAPGDPELKYLDHEHWLQGVRRRMSRTGLLGGARRQVLDLGCGAGWFAAWANHCGHDAIGLDVPSRSALFRRLTEALCVPVIDRAVLPLQELTGLGHHWGMVTAFQVTFNGHASDRVWGPDEWAFLVEDLQCRADAIHLELNREPDGSSVTPAIRDALERLGCRIEAHVVRWSR